MGQYISSWTPQEPMLTANTTAAPISSHLINKEAGLDSPDINIRHLGKLYKDLSQCPSNIKSIKSLYSMSNRPSTVIPPNEISKPALRVSTDNINNQTNVKTDKEAIESPDEPEVENIELNQVIIEDNKSDNKLSAHLDKDLPSQHDETSENQQFKILTLQASNVNDGPIDLNQMEVENKQNDLTDATEPENQIPSQPISQHTFTQRVVSQVSLGDASGSQFISEDGSLSQQFLPDTSESQQDYSDILASPRVIDDRSGSKEDLDNVASTATGSLDSRNFEDIPDTNAAEVISVSQQVSMDLTEQMISDQWKSVNAKAPIQNDKISDRLKDVVFNIPEVSEFRVAAVANDSEILVWLKDVLIESTLQKSNY